MTFKKDFRQSNPGLHELYVGWAMNFLQEAQDFCETMFAHSNFNASELASPVKECIVRLIDEDAAFHDAAARLFAGQEPPPMHEDLAAAEEAAPSSSSGEDGLPVDLEKLFAPILNPFKGARILQAKISNGKIISLSNEPANIGPGIYPTHTITPADVLAAFFGIDSTQVPEIKAPLAFAVRIGDS